MPDSQRNVSCVSATFTQFQEETHETQETGSIRAPIRAPIRCGCVTSFAARSPIRLPMTRGSLHGGSCPVTSSMPGKDRRHERRRPGCPAVPRGTSKVEHLGPMMERTAPNGRRLVESEVRDCSTRRARAAVRVPSVRARRRALAGRRHGSDLLEKLQLIEVEVLSHDPVVTNPLDADV